MPRVTGVELDKLPPQIGDPTWQRVAAHCPEQLVHM